MLNPDLEYVFLEELLIRVGVFLVKTFNFPPDLVIIGQKNMFCLKKKKKLIQFVSYFLILSQLVIFCLIWANFLVKTPRRKDNFFDFCFFVLICLILSYFVSIEKKIRRNVVKACRNAYLADNI